MKKHFFALAMLTAALVCFTTSCKKDDEKKDDNTPVAEKTVDYQLRVYLTEKQLDYLDCEVAVNVPGMEEQTIKVEKGKSNIVKADTGIDNKIIAIAEFIEPAPQIYVCLIEYNGLKAGEATAKVTFSRNATECKDTAETLNVAIGALWTARADSQHYTQIAGSSRVYGGVYATKLEEFLTTIENPYETKYRVY